MFNSGSGIEYFSNALNIWYPGTGSPSFNEYSPPGGSDTLYVVQENGDTLNLGPKATGLMFDSILTLMSGGIYSLFLTGADTSSPDYLVTTDSLPYHSPTDSTVGIRFVNLSTGSQPISINLEGGAPGSEVGSLPYKGITGFRNYVSNSTVTNSTYLFVIRDLATGDSLISFGLNSRTGLGLLDPNNGNILTFRNATIAVYGLENPSSSVPLGIMLIDDY